LKEKIGYAFGDFGCTLSFSLVGSLLQKFYTDILLLPAASITLLFLIARLWDAVNDPLWGRIVDTIKPTKSGRYRKWMLIFALPLGVSTVLMFMKIPGLTQKQYLIYAYITYILYGMLYTCANIPYGSLASVITTDEKERSVLSIFRSVGSGVGGLPAMVLAGLVFVTVTVNGEQITQMDYNKLLLGVGVISALSAFIFYLSYKWTRERVIPSAVTAKKQKMFSWALLKNLFMNRPLMILCLASMLLITAQMFMASFYIYIFDDYFVKPGLYTLTTVCSYAPMGIIMFFVPKIVEKIGKKEICALGALLSALSNFILFVIKTHNPYVFLVFAFISGCGLSFFALLVWALVTDVIDYHKYRRGCEDEATCYSFFSFTRKLGHTLAGVLATQALVIIGYEGAKEVQDKFTVTQMYNIGVFIPALLFFAMFAALWFFYPLSKKKLKELEAEKNQLLK
jgi:GPH family glycoside/pentoside/hexuronide:cation symporter